MVRESEGRDATPSGAIIDSQSVRTTEKGAKRLRRREEGVGTQAPHHNGYHWAALGRGDSCRQHPGPGQSQAGAGQTLGRFPRLQVMWADAAYTGQRVAWAWPSPHPLPSYRHR